MIQPEFMMRVKLPNPSGYASCPSGDTDYEAAYNKAMSEALPEGFKAIKERLGVHRPIDSAGFAYVRLRCTDEKNRLAVLMDEVARLGEIVSAVKLAVKSA